METTRRSLTKAVIWNVIGLITMGIVGFLATGSVMLGGATALINTCVGFCCYIVYERIWSRILWGLK